MTFFTHAPCGSMGQQMDFLPTPASVVVWVFRWQVSPPLLLPPLPHLQICQQPLTKTWFQQPLSIETENAVGGGGGGGTVGQLWGSLNNNFIDSKRSKMVQN